MNSYPYFTILRRKRTHGSLAEELETTGLIVAELYPRVQCLLLAGEQKCVSNEVQQFHTLIANASSFPLSERRDKQIIIPATPRNAQDVP